MSFLYAIFGIIYLAYRLGKDEGRWGCFSAIVAFLVISYFISQWR